MHIAITGASSGIGATYARHFGAKGHKLTLVARRGELLTRLARELGEANVHVVIHDLADPQLATAWIPGAEAVHGPIDVLVNNAGVQIVGRTHEVDPELAERLLAVDLLSPLRLTRALLPGMIARGAGTIVDVASMAALAPTPGMTSYNAAKAGLAAASESLRGELRGTGVHVVTVYPGIIGSTDMAKAALQKYQGVRGLGATLLSSMPQGTEQRLAELTLRAIERRVDRVIYPRSGVLSRWFPGTTRWILDRLTPRLGAAQVAGVLS
jgi:uncharacterized protein